MPYLHLFGEKIFPPTGETCIVPEIYQVESVDRDGSTIEALRPNGETWFLHTSNYKRVVISDSSKPKDWNDNAIRQR